MTTKRVKPLTPEQRRRRRNRLQRARRSQPGAAAREALASRRSYWRRREGWGHEGFNGLKGCGSPCLECRAIAKEHALCG